MSEKPKLPFERTNYIMMLAGIVMLIVGFVVMANDSEPYGFGDIGLTVGPIIVMLGFIIEFAAILYKPKSN